MLAVIWLGIGPTGIATIILFSVIDRAGPTFLSTINYLVPVVAFFCGAWLLSEPVSWHHFVALATILSGIAITRIRGQESAWLRCSMKACTRAERARSGCARAHKLTVRSARIASSLVSCAEESPSNSAASASPIPAFGRNAHRDKGVAAQADIAAINRAR